jgi:hypothetical protein
MVGGSCLLERRRAAAKVHQRDRWRVSQIRTAVFMAVPPPQSVISRGCLDGLGALQAVFHTLPVERVTPDGLDAEHQ